MYCTGHLRGPVALTSIAERLALELLLQNKYFICKQLKSSLIVTSFLEKKETHRYRVEIMKLVLRRKLYPLINILEVQRVFVTLVQRS